MIRKEGDYPANARTEIDYSGKEPKIEFSYPDNGKSPKQQALKQHRFGVQLIPLLIIFVGIPALFFYSTPFFSDYQWSPSECNLSYNQTYHNLTGVNKTHILNLNLTCDNKTYEYHWDGVINKLEGIESGFEPKSNQTWKSPIIILGIIMVINYILVFTVISPLVGWLLLKSERYRKWFPEHQAKGRRKKYIKFTPEDVDNLMVEIPSFSNVSLDYKTDGDFSKQLVKVKVHEHQYYKYDDKKKKIGKKKVKLYDWYARFYFKEKPKDGFMEVVFR